MNSQNTQTQKYQKETLYHFGNIFSPPKDNRELQTENLKNRLIELCVRVGNNNDYSPIKTIRVLDIKTPNNTATGDRSAGRGKILYYLDTITNKNGEITYGDTPEWLKNYNTNNSKSYDSSDIYVNLLPFDFVGMNTHDSNPKPTGGKKAKKQKSKKAKKQKSKKRRTRKH